ncbi:MAG: hypothetical protein IJL97_01625, partial [Lachnospiraceae bacterium]|nr:hypothetical protein [Lachnospiraceae bacterium]
MALKLIIGSARSEKSEAMYKDLIRLSLEHSDINYILIVPEQYSLRTQRKIADMHPHGGTMNIDVLTFKRLAYRIFEELGTVDRTVLSDIEKSMYVRKILEEQKDRLSLFGSYAGREGFIDETKKVISDIMESKADPVTLLGIADREEAERPLFAAKIRDTLVVYEEFRRMMGESRITEEDILDILTQVTEKSEIIKNSYIYLDEFNSFSPAQYDLIRALLERSRGLIASLTIDPAAKPYDHANEYELFAVTKDTLEKLEKLCADAHIRREEDLIVNNSGEAGPPEITALAKNIYRFKRGVCSGECRDVSSYLCAGPDDEMRCIARTIKNLVMKEGLRYRDIAVVTASIETYEKYAKRHFAKENIPCFIDSTRPLSGNACAKLIKALIALCEENYS